MRPPKHCLIPVLILLLVLNLGKSYAEEVQSHQPTPLKIFVSILPAQYFVDRVGGDRVQVETLVQPGHSPATYAPTPKQMAKLASAKIYFTIGVPFENSLIPKLNRSVPQLETIDLQKNISLQSLSASEPHDDHQHEDGELDPHTWLDPTLAMKQALIIRDSLIDYDPGGKDEYIKNYANLAADLSKLDQSLSETFKPYAGTTLFVFHPAYGYLCRAYQLKQRAITPNGKDPGAKHIARIIEQARDEKAKIIFVQPQFSNKAARTIAQAIDGKVVALDPLAYDYLKNMESIGRQIVSSLPEPKN